jgi:hypothetical protein
VIYSKYSGRAVSLLILLPIILTAQNAREHVVPLKNWATPLYWHPNQAEREVLAKPVPQLQFSPNAVSGDALIFVGITPCRLVDTRGDSPGAGFVGDMPFSGPSISPGATATFPVQSSTEEATTAPAPCGTIPPIAEAYSFNLTVVPHSGGAVGYVTLFPASPGGTPPYVATLNDGQGAVVNNAAIVPAGTPSGGISVFNSGPATIDVVIDMNGFFAAPTDVNNNTALGLQSLADNNGGTYNTAAGAFALTTNTSGSYNTASGYNALASNISGSYNTASGVSALASNTDGADNTATGNFALQDNTGGGHNTASGYEALLGNTMGTDNTAIGYTALVNNTSGSSNIAIGSGAGSSAPATNGSSIYIGSQGANNDNVGTIQIGTQGTQTGGTYIAGISGGTPSATNSLVCIDATGLLGTNCGATPSSLRFKEHIADMGDSSDKLFQLRPVTFFYKPQYDDGSHSLQYGLIAEEVAKLYPEMVGYDKAGRPASVKYQWLAPMLLNELQKQAAQMQQQAEQIRSLEDRLAALEAALSKGSPSESPDGSPASPDTVR